VTADLMQKYSDGIGCGQPELMQDQLGIPFESFVKACPNVVSMCHVTQDIFSANVPDEESPLASGMAPAGCSGGLVPRLRCTLYR